MEKAWGVTPRGKESQEVRKADADRSLTTRSAIITTRRCLLPITPPPHCLSFLILPVVSSLQHWLTPSLPCCNSPIMSHSAAELQKPTGEYRQYLPDLSLKRFQVMRNQDAHEYAHDFKTLKNPPWLHALYMHWVDLLQEPFKGVTTDGMFFFPMNPPRTAILEGQC